MTPFFHTKLLGWLEPLLDRIHQNPATLASPHTDSIDMETFKYNAGALENIFIGGFDWNLVVRPSTLFTQTFNFSI